VLRLFAIGLGLGVATGLPLGLVNVAIVEAARRGGLRRATGIGLGGGTADATHAWLACAGIGPLLAHRPLLAPILYLASGAAIAGFGLALLRDLRRRRAPAASASVEPDSAAAPADSGRRPLLAGIGIGLSLTLPNPAALAAWVAVVGAVAPSAGPDGGALFAAGVGLGSMLWFALLAALAGRGTDLVARGRGLTLLLAAGAIGYGLYAAGRGAYLLWL
jgi:arginine exporter protein ArgO